MTHTINDLPLNFSNNKNVKKSSLYGFLGSTLSCLSLFLIMWFYVMPRTSIVPQVEDEGLMVSFGYNEDGGGQGENPKASGYADAQTVPINKATATSTVETKKTTTVTPTTVKATVSKPSSQDYITQSEASLAIAEKKKNTERLQQQSVDNERIATEKRVADKKRKEQEAINKANSSMSGVFGNGNAAGNGVFGNANGTSATAGNGSGNGTGSGSGSGSQGNPAGKGYAGGNSWSLNGRSLTGRLISPTYDKDVEGKITVNIRVNKNGMVTSANIGSNTTISDTSTRNAAVKAAMNTHFSTGKGESVGSIVYNFKLK